jgi:hypothetical protein
VDADAVDRCDSRWSATQCELVNGHQSAHAARQDAALISWVNSVAGDHAGDLVLDWFDGAK